MRKEQKPRYLPCDPPIALVWKSGTSSISEAIRKAGLAGPPPVFVGASRAGLPGYQMAGKTVSGDDIGEAVILVRDPIERFRSAFAQSEQETGRSVGEVLDSLETDVLGDNGHYTPTHWWLLDNGANYLYRFPEHLNSLGKLCGVEWPTNNVKEPGQKPSLTETERDRVKQIYLKDYLLWEAATAPHTVYVK